MFLIKALSTLVCADFLASDTVLSPFFSSFPLPKKASSILLTSTPSTPTLVDVAITYFWLTRRSGTPFTEYGPNSRQSK